MQDFNGYGSSRKLQVNSKQIIMNSPTNISLMLLIITTLLLYFAGLVAVYKSSKKYHYSKLWFVLALFLFVCPPFIFVLISLCERAELKKNKNDYIKGKIKVRIALSVFIFYCLLYPLFIVFLKYSSTNSDWYEEIGMVCVNIVMLALIPLYLYVKKQIVHFFTDMPIKA